MIPLKLKDRRAMSESRVLEMSSSLTLVRPDPMGGGSFADVFQYMHEDGRLCAVKTLRTHAIDNIDDPAVASAATRSIYSEAQRWHDLTHPNILPMLGVYLDNNNQSGFPSLVCPWMKNKDARKYFQDPLHRTNTNFLNFISKIAYGLTYLHSREIVHGDLRGPNILIDDDGEPRISDLGFAKVANANMTSTGVSEWPAVNQWSPPEYLVGGDGSNGPSPETSADVYSFGATTIELWTGANPFSESFTTPRLTMHFATNKTVPGPPEQGQTEFQGLKEHVHEVFGLCCEFDPSLRITIANMAHMLANRSVNKRNTDFKEEEDDTKLHALLHDSDDRHTMPVVSDRSVETNTTGTCVPTPMTGANHPPPAYPSRNATVTPMQKRVVTPAPPIPRTSNIKREESDSDILTDAFNNQRISPVRTSSLVVNGSPPDGLQDIKTSPRLLSLSPRQVSPEIGNGFSPASPVLSQDRPIDLRVLPPPPSPDDGPNVPCVTALNNIHLREKWTLDYDTGSTGEKHIPLWYAKCYINGELYGDVSNKPDKKAAKEEAARLTLEMLRRSKYQDAILKERYFPALKDHLKANRIDNLFADLRYTKCGEDHEPIWNASIFLNGAEFARGSDRRKENAEDQAARIAASKWRVLHSLRP